MDFNENIIVRKVFSEIKRIEIIFEAYQKINPKTGEEVFDRELGDK